VTSVVVVGDVHGNARALRAALLQARSGPLDHLVFVGDLLTYGHDVSEVLDLVGEAQQKDGAVLLIGNHDQMYFDLAQGRRDYLDKLPAWIQDSVALTVKKFDPATLRERLRWSDEWWLGSALFAHANPFGPGDFRYLNSEDDCAAAVEALERRRATLGVFGHTHRAAWRQGEVILANAGSVGQPRDARGSLILRVTLANGTARGSFEPIDYDVQGHVAELRRAELPETTIARLVSFFERNQ